MMAAKPVVFVIGASGTIGMATVQALADRYAGKVEIRAGTRCPDKADMLKAIPNITLVQAEMGEKVKLKQTLRGVDALYIVTPPAGEERVPLVTSTAQVAKEAGVKHLLAVSGVSAAIPDMIIGKQFAQVEAAIAGLGVPYTFLRLPFFLDDVKTKFKESIKERGVFSSPGFDGSKPLTAVVVADAGNAAAAILADPEKHTNKTYQLVSDRFTYDGIAATFSEVLGKKVTYTFVPFNRQATLAAGVPEITVNIIEQLIGLVNEGSTVYDDLDLSHYQCITGEQPTSVKSWVSQFKEHFL